MNSQTGISSENFSTQIPRNGLRSPISDSETSMERIHTVDQVGEHSLKPRRPSGVAIVKAEVGGCEVPLPIVILCVDDDHIALTVRRLLLSVAGYTVLTAASVEAALGLFRRNHVDLVITDHLLPDGTGAELTFQIKRLRPEVQVVLLTGWMDLPPGYDHADLALTKGLTAENFLAEIATLLSTSHPSPSASIDKP
jgi:CheY-like chemotaxis protein